MVSRPSCVGRYPGPASAGRFLSGALPPRSPFAHRDGFVVNSYTRRLSSGIGIELWLVVMLTFVLGAGHWLLLPGLRNLTRRAKTLRMWPDRRDEPPQPWSIWPEWTFALLGDLFRLSEQRDPKYLGYQRRVRWGAALVGVGFSGVALLVKLSEN